MLYLYCSSMDVGVASITNARHENCKHSAESPNVTIAFSNHRDRSVGVYWP